MACMESPALAALGGLVVKVHIFGVVAGVVAGAAWGSWMIREGTVCCSIVSGAAGSTPEKTTLQFITRAAKS